MAKQKIPSLSYNSMFKAVMKNNPEVLKMYVEEILKYCKSQIDLSNKNIKIRENELTLSHHDDKQLICDFILEVDENTEINIELNRTRYIGLEERNVTYCFKIYSEHFKKGDNKKDFKNYHIIQVNFNKFKNINNKRYEEYMLIDSENREYILTESLKILNIDIESCYNFVYNNNKDVSKLDRLSAMINCDTIEDIDYILGSEIMSKDNKKNLLNNINEIGNSDEIKNSLKLEDTVEEQIDYYVRCAAEDAKEKGFEQGIEQGIKKMLEMKMSYDDIIKISGKSLEEIKEIEKLCK